MRFAERFFTSGATIVNKADVCASSIDEIH